ncbi:MAG: DUF4832 domain-containing protein [Planctomycetota bacterium]
MIGLLLRGVLGVATLAGVPAYAGGGSGADAAECVEHTFLPSAENFPNPNRGLYVQLSDRRQEPLSARRLERLYDRGITLVLRQYYLKGYRDRALDAEQLGLIQRDFDTLRRTGLKAIVRFAYSSRIGEPDAPRPIVLRHIAQVGPLLRENADVIFTVQAGFVGAWGEWHASTNGLTDPDALRAIAGALLDELPDQLTIQVRTPRHKQLLTGTRSALMSYTGPTAEDGDRDGGQLARRIGHHNDCFLADETDVGTYRRRSLDADRRYLELDSRYVPVGGETCRLAERSDPAFAREELRRMHWSFLNLAYHRGVIAKWRESGFLDEVQRRLGARPRLVSLRAPRRVRVGSPLRIEMMIANDGWAAPLQDQPVVLRLNHSTTDTSLTLPLDVDTRAWAPGDQSRWVFSLIVPDMAPSGRYTLDLIIADPNERLESRSRYRTRLANADTTWTEAGENALGVHVFVEAQDSTDATPPRDEG